VAGLQPNITEPIPVAVGNPQNTPTYSATGVAYDISIGGQPFFLLNDDNNPYRRVTAQYRKNQVDMSREPGEQTLTGWWLRSQSSFHLGQGVKFFEPAQDESLRFQYTYSKGCNVWTKGQVTLLKDVDGGIHKTTGGLQANGRPNQLMRSIQWKKTSYTGATTTNLYNGVLMVDEYDADKIYPRISVAITNKALTSNVATLTTSAAHGLSVGMEINVTGVDATFNGTFTITTIPTATTFTYAKTASNVTSTAVSPPGAAFSDVTHFIDYNAGTDYPVYGLCDDGVWAYWVTNQTSGGLKLAVYKKLLTDDATVSPTLMFTATGVTVTNAVMEFTKERIVMAANNKVYEFAASATTLPSPVYTHPVDDFVYTSITSSGTAIYLTGYTGIQSTIQKFTLTTAGAMPTLTSAITAAELPVGEICYKISYYLGYMCIGTNLGARIAAVSDTDGSIAYGPLIFETTQPVYDFAFRDKFIWCASSVEGQVGVTRINLGQQISSLVFAYAWDLYDQTDTLGHYTTACAFLGNLDRLAFCNAGNGVDGYVYIEAESDLIPEGKLQTGYVRYNTIDNKIFKYIVPRFDTSYGSLSILSVDQFGNEFTLGAYAQGSEVGQVGIAYPPGSQQYLGFEFTIGRSSSGKDYTVTGAGVSGGYTIQIAATTDVIAGNIISGNNIVEGTKVKNITTSGSTSTLVVDTAFTGAISAGATISIIDTSRGPTLTGYQLKVLPAVPRQRLIQYPCSLFDSESDKFGNKSGYDGSAYERLKAIEAIESNGDTLVVQDFRPPNGETFTGIIEEIDFINKTPTDKRYSGWGGLCLITIRTIS
jgi:hypothetical protein